MQVNIIEIVLTAPQITRGMCISPLSKRNPYFHADPGKHMFRDTEHEFLNIPCGHCDECLAVRQNAYVQRVQMEAKFNHLFFATLTYDNKHLPAIYVDVPVDESQNPMPDYLAKDSQAQQLSLDLLFSEDESVRTSAIQALSDSAFVERLAKVDEYLSDAGDFDDLSYLYEESFDDSPFSLEERPGTIRVTYADIHHLQLMFKRMRDNNTLGRDFRYLAVTERGSARGRPHVHIIFFVPKHKNDNVASCETLNEALKDMLLRYWSTNVGTRKHPVYERNFTYRQKWIGRKLYRNFDCHYVNPSLTTEGVSNVSFYVTKYIFKDSDKENKLKQLLWCKTADFREFRMVWDIVKSRMVCSKGLGLDAVFYTCDEPFQVSKPLYEQAQESLAQIRVLEDLPGSDFELTPVDSFKIVWKRTRKMVPNFDLMQELKANACKEPARGRAIFVSYNGQHLPLANYYCRRVLDMDQLTDLYYSWDPQKYPDKHFRPFEMDEESIHKITKRLADKKAQIDAHEVLDARSFDIEEGMSIDPYDEYRGLGKYLNLDNHVRPQIFLGK